MTTDHRRVDAELAQAVLLCERVVQHILEAVMTEHIGAAPYERLEGRTGHRNGHKPRMLRTRVGTLNLVVPQDRERTLSTRKVKDVFEALCGDSPLRCVSCSFKVFVVQSSMGQMLQRLYPSRLPHLGEAQRTPLAEG